MPECCLIQFAKRPIAGLVKTRLIPELGAARALDVHEALLRKTLNVLLESDLGPVELWWDAHWDDADAMQRFLIATVEPSHMAQARKLMIRYQEGADLGERMSHALAQGLRQSQKTLLVGSDCPVITPDYLRQAMMALDHSDVVLGPAEDGGYVLIGARNITSLSLCGMAWGVETVLQATIARLGDAGLSHQLLPVSWDVDDYSDYLRWRQEEERSHSRVD
ncbi:TIGR04282 family arsenosugar biosynthesis glycosyltransferase [Hahella sp. NBU794]|uniref:TIGR04282 family arsenosugar biosynthesis glycosyltransferase n=1 Tax=Hahella sp. NBU794 TaxID=3422590 RepID=UPI003D6FCBBE